MSILEIPAPPSIMPPREAYRYWPDSSYISTGSNKKAIRHIFEFQKLSDFENEKLSRLENLIKQGKIEGFQVPSNWSRNHLLRFCYGTGWKTRNSVKALVSYLKWQAERVPLGWQSLYERVLEPLVRLIQKSGVFYVCGRDSMYRPLVILDFNKIDFKSASIDLYSDTLCFLLEYVVNFMLIPGQVENWVVLIDLGKKGLGNLNINSLKQVLSILQVNFRCRMGVTFIVNPPKSMYMLWSCVKPFLDEVLIEKIKISNSETSPEMLSLFNPSQVEQKYGGKLENLEKFWPPTVNESSFDSVGAKIKLSHVDSYHRFNSLCEKLEEIIEESPVSFNESERVSLKNAENEIPSISFQSPEKIDQKENFYLLEKGKNEKENSSSKALRSNLAEKSVNVVESNGYLMNKTGNEFDTPKKKGPRPITIRFEKNDGSNPHSNFGCCENGTVSCLVF